ncbi:helix-turn-helix domain-containing protein [Sphingobacterium hotanense]|uniref:helix-turn-helix domain-containing protein n=1 Tax=Sphingobacterium hotanense TaxID=649196 RepID=UPI0011F12F47|nr:AraC family transcriptional regulator [Sphingobacterium hotanense]
MFSLILFTVIVVFSCINLRYNKRLPLKTKFDEVILIFNCIVGLHALFGGIFRTLIPELKYVDLGAPIGLLYGPLLFQLFVSIEKDKFSRRSLFYNLLPFFLFLTVYIIFLISEEFRTVYGVTYLKILYISFGISWLLYPTILLFKATSKARENNPNQKKYFFFTMMMLLLASFEIPYALSYNGSTLSQTYVSSSNFVYLIMLIVMIMLHNYFFNLLNRHLSSDSSLISKFNYVQQVIPAMGTKTNLAHSSDQEKILQYLATHPYLDANFNVEKIKKDLKLTQQQINLLFKSLFGFGFIQAINTLRIDAACLELEKDVLNIAIDELAFQCGFNSRASFYRHFKIEKKCSPHDYREKVIKKMKKN